MRSTPTRKPIRATSTRAFPPQGRFVEADGARLHVREAGPEGAPRAAADPRRQLQPARTVGAAGGRSSRRCIASSPTTGPAWAIPRARGRDAHTLAAQARCAAACARSRAAPAPRSSWRIRYGAAVALRLALDHPARVRGLVLIAPACNPYPGKPAWWARLSATPVLGDIFCGLLIPWLGPLMSARQRRQQFLAGADACGLRRERRPAAHLPPARVSRQRARRVRHQARIRRAAAALRASCSHLRSSSPPRRTASFRPSAMRARSPPSCPPPNW